MSDDKLIGAGSPVKEFVNKMVKQAEDGLVDTTQRISHVKFELEVASKTEKGAGLNLWVLDVDAKKEGLITQKVTFETDSKPDEADIAERRAIKEEAETRAYYAEVQRKPLVRPRL